MDQLEKSNRDNILKMAANTSLRALSREWYSESAKYKYEYHFTWLGRPIIQLPQDILAMQEIIFRVKPDLIVETGIARGGSLIFYASMLELLGRNGQVLGIDIDIRDHNRVEIEKHPMFKKIAMIEGSSTDEAVVRQVYGFAERKSNVMVALDSNHTHQHVLKELKLYSPIVTKGSYLVVFDTVIEDMPEGSFPDRPWDKGDNPRTAVQEFLETDDQFEIDKDIADKLLITQAPDGFLKRVRD